MEISAEIRILKWILEFLLYLDSLYKKRQHTQTAEDTKLTLSEDLLYEFFQEQEDPKKGSRQEKNKLHLVLLALRTKQIMYCTLCK